MPAKGGKKSTYQYRVHGDGVYIDVIGVTIFITKEDWIKISKIWEVKNN